MRLLGQDTTTFAAEHQKRCLDKKSPLSQLDGLIMSQLNDLIMQIRLTNSLILVKTKKVLSNYQNDYIERFRNISQGNVHDS